MDVVAVVTGAVSGALAGGLVSLLAAVQIADRGEVGQQRAQARTAMVERIAAEREGVIGCWTSSSLGGGLRYGDMAHDQFSYDVLKLSRTLGRRLRQRVREGLIQLCGEATAVAMVEEHRAAGNKGPKRSRRVGVAAYDSAQGQGQAR